jgi:hypothetical protein
MSITLAYPIIARNLADLERRYKFASLYMHEITIQLKIIQDEFARFTEMFKLVQSDNIDLMTHVLEMRLASITKLADDCTIVLNVLSEQINTSRIVLADQYHKN